MLARGIEYGLCRAGAIVWFLQGWRRIVVCLSYCNNNEEKGKVPYEREPSPFWMLVKSKWVRGKTCVSGKERYRILHSTIANAQSHRTIQNKPSPALHRQYCMCQPCTNSTQIPFHKSFWRLSVLFLRKDLFSKRF